MKSTVKIVADSAADLLSLADVPFESAPLKVITAHREYTDTAALDVAEMVQDLQHYKGKSSTSCPNAADWLAAFDEAEEIYCVTLTSGLSGSYNAARMAKATYEEEHPDRRVFVLDSLSAGPEMTLLVERLRELVLQELPFEEVCESITAYAKGTGLVFMLASMKNLANNGRVKPLVAKMAGLLNICVVGKASDQGELAPLYNCRGEARALDAIVQHLKEAGVKAGKVCIAHCFNASGAQRLKEKLAAALPAVTATVHACRGLCSFYAERGGLLVGYEKA